MTSFLTDITYDPLETWLLPKSDMLCMIRCQEDPHEDAREDGQATKSMDEENQRKKESSPSRPRTSGPRHPAPGASPSASAKPAKSTGPGHPASSPDIRPPDIQPSTWTSDPWQQHLYPPPRFPSIFHQILFRCPHILPHTPHNFLIPPPSLNTSNSYNFGPILL